MPFKIKYNNEVHSINSGKKSCGWCQFIKRTDYKSRCGIFGLYLNVAEERLSICRESEVKNED